MHILPYYSASYNRQRVELQQGNVRLVGGWVCQYELPLSSYFPGGQAHLQVGGTFQMTRPRDRSCWLTHPKSTKEGKVHTCHLHGKRFLLLL